jgi:hypothetical protein
MPQYMLMMIHPAEGPPKEDWAEQNRQWSQFHQDLVDAGVLVCNYGLQGAEAATTVRVRDGETQITDGPFAETKELLAGVFLLDVPDLDAALKYAAQMPNVTYGAVEVRPVWGG